MGREQIVNQHAANMLSKLLIWVDSHFVMLIVVFVACFLVYVLAGKKRD